jgi:hypothetical protein
MKTKSFKNSGLSLHRLKIEISSISIYAERDAAELQTVGIQNQDVIDLRSSLKSLNSLRDYRLAAADKKVLTFERNRKKKVVQGDIYLLREQMSRVSNYETGFYDAIFSVGLSSAKMGEFIQSALSVLNVLTENGSLAASYGVSDVQTAAFKQNVEQLIAAEEAQKTATKSFKTVTAERNQVKEEAFARLVRIASIGKAYWRYRKPALSAEYSIARKPLPKHWGVAEES